MIKKDIPSRCKKGQVIGDANLSLSKIIDMQLVQKTLFPINDFTRTRTKHKERQMLKPTAKDKIEFQQSKKNINGFQEVTRVTEQLSLFETNLLSIEEEIEQTYKSIILRYQKLLSLDSMTDSQAESMHEILSLSEGDHILTFLLSQVDATLYMEDESLECRNLRAKHLESIVCEPKDLDLSHEFEQQLRIRIGNEEYQAWEERLKC
jgi:hypothetical protein